LDIEPIGIALVDEDIRAADPTDRWGQTSFVDSHCMENDIDLLIMPAHCSHLFQPLDVGVFAAYKGAHSQKTDAVDRLSS
jgi:hypothetical protein